MNGLRQAFAFLAVATVPFLALAQPEAISVFPNHNFGDEPIFCHVLYVYPDGDVRPETAIPPEGIDFSKCIARIPGSVLSIGQAYRIRAMHCACPSEDVCHSLEATDEGGKRPVFVATGQALTVILVGDSVEPDPALIFSDDFESGGVDRWTFSQDLVLESSESPGS